MFRVWTPRPALILFFTLLLSLILAPMVFAAQSDSPASRPPRVPPHGVSFQITGLPAGIAFTITGTRINPGSHDIYYTSTFTSPGPSGNISTEPGSEFTYSGFPAFINSGGADYTLDSVTPASPFNTGAASGDTVVVAAYTASCAPPQVTADPAPQTVTYGDPFSFTVAATGTATLSYQWYKDNNPISGANLSTYSQASASMSDAGAYHAAVTNTCGSDTSASAALTVNKANQTISFDQPTSPAVYNTTFTVSPTASSGLPVTLVASGSCTNSGFDVTMTSGEGVCTLTASQAGDGNYNPANDVIRTVDAAKASQTITFDQPPTPAVYNTTFTVSPSASSTLPVTLTSFGSCTNTGYDVTMTSGEGVCMLTASQAGNANYSPATDVIQLVDAAKADQTITFAAPPSPVPYLGTFDVAPTASSGLPVTLVLTGGCSLSGSTVTMYVPYGSCTITASQPGDNNYNPATDVQHVVELPPVEVIFAPLMLRTTFAP